MEPHYYQVNVNWNKDRKGILCSPELNNQAEQVNNCIEVATPPQFEKGIPNIWSPEHLFTAAVNSCFMTTFLSIAENSKLDFISFSSQGKGKLEQVEDKFLMTEVVLEATLVIANEADKEKAERILHKSEAACLISNSIKSKVSLIAKVNVDLKVSDSVPRHLFLNIIIHSPILLPTNNTHFFNYYDHRS